MTTVTLKLQVLCQCTVMVCKTISILKIHLREEQTDIKHPQNSVNTNPKQQNTMKQLITPFRDFHIQTNTQYSNNYPLCRVTFHLSSNLLISAVFLTLKPYNLAFTISKILLTVSSHVLFSSLKIL